MKNGKPFEWELENGRIIEDVLPDKQQQFLIFNLAKPSDAGKYQCFPTNKYGVGTSYLYNVIQTKKNGQKVEKV